MATPSASFRSMLSYSLMMSIGAGVLSLPQNVSRTGVLASLVVALYVGLGILWCMLLMLRAKTACEAHGIRIATYRDFGEHLLGGQLGRRVVEVAVCGFQFGVLCVYFQFIASTLSTVFPGAFVGWRRFAWMAAFYPVICLLCCLRYLRDLGSVAEVATTLYTLGWLLVIGYCLERLSNRAWENTRLSPKHTDWSIVGIFAALCYSFEGIPAALCQTVDTLDQRDRAAELITVAILMITAIYIFTQFAGAFAFERPGDPISLSLISHDGATLLPVTLNLCFVFAVFLKYPLQFFPLITIVERNCNFGPGSRVNVSGVQGNEAKSLATTNRSKTGAVDTDPLIGDASDADDSVWISDTDGTVSTVVAFRSFIVLCSALVAFFINDLTELINLVGILFAPLLAIVFPCIFDLEAAHRFGLDERMLPIDRILTYFMLATGTTFWLFGSVQQCVKLGFR